MATQFQIDTERFATRVKKMTSSWKWPIDTLLVVLGKHGDDALEPKGVAMVQWLLGVEVPDCIMAVTRTGRTIFFSTQKKIDILRQVEGPNVSLIVRKPGPEGSEVDPDQLAELAALLRDGKDEATVGTLLKEQHVGAVAEAFLKALPGIAGIKVVDCREEVSEILAPKDEAELALTKNAALCVTLLENFFVSKLEEIIDLDNPRKQSEICEMVEREIESESGSLTKSWQAKHGLDPSELDLLYVSLQSGRQFELKPLVMPLQEVIPMHGTFLLSVALKYAEYSACIARTMVVDPIGVQKEAYQLTIDVQRAVIAALKPGAVFKDIYTQARDLVVKRHPSLLDRFVKSVGWVMGIEFKDPQLSLAEKSEKQVLPGMVFCVSAGFSDPTWALWLADTVMVPLGGGPCEVLTSGSSNRPADIMYELEDPNAPKPEAPKVKAEQKEVAAGMKGKAAEKAPAPKAKGKGKAKAKGGAKKRSKSEDESDEDYKEEDVSEEEKPRRSARHKKEKEKKKPVKTYATRRAAAASVPEGNLKGRLRSSNLQTKMDMSEQVRLEEEMKELRLKKLEELRERFAGRSLGAATSESSTKRLDHYKAYKSSDELPKDAQPNRLQVDIGKEALLVPMNGMLVPFHARTIKNMARSQLDGVQFLRVNFFTPGQGKSLDDYPSALGNRLYIKELSFRSESKDNLDAVMRAFKEVQHGMKQKALEKEHKKTASEEVGALNVTRGKFPCLRDLHVRPTVQSGGRKMMGNLEAHQNGFRFSIKNGEKVDILYSQLKIPIFEPSEVDTLYTIIHLHLKAPVILGKKRVQDIQFLASVVQESEDLSQRRGGSAHDPDEVMEEQRERDIKVRLNQMFQEFTKEVEALPGFGMKFDIPFKALEFKGVPYKSTVMLTPSAKGLVSLQEWPPFCLEVADLDIVAFERALINNREFDITFVFKDYEIPPVRVTTIPTNKLSAIKQWLRSLEVVWYSSSMNMQWPLVMKEINKDPRKFLEQGGWNYWFTSAEEDSDSSAERDGDSDFSAEEDGDDDDESDFSPGDDDEEEDEPSDDEEEEGMDWDALEREAERSDRKRDSERAGARLPERGAKKGRR